jgi:hypothetical protein
MSEPKVYDFSSPAPEPKKYDLTACEVCFGIDIPEPEPILKINDVLILSRGNISTVKGKAKARKSFLIALLCSMVLKQNYTINVLIIDTEQSRHFVAKVLNRVYRLMGWTSANSRLKVLTLREYEFMQRREIMVQVIDEYCPDFIVLDGGVDIIGDFNNADESKEVIGLLMKLSTEKNCHILNVLHEGKTNGELRGHYGAEALNKSETVFEVVKDGDVSNVRPYATRNIAFDEFSFKVTEQGLPEYLGTVQTATKVEIQNANVRNCFIDVLKPDKAEDYTSLVALYSERGACSERTSKTHIVKAVKLGVIAKNDADGLYRLTEYNNSMDRPF